MRSGLAFPSDCCARSDSSSSHQADRPLRPTHYFIAHTALVRQLVFISTPPPRLANRAAHDLDGSPTGIISVGYDGSTMLSDLREPGGATSTLTHERSASPSRSPRPLPCSFSDDLDVLQLRSTRSPSRRTRAWRTRPTPTTVSRPSGSSRACRATRAESRSTAGPSGCVLLSLSLSHHFPLELANRTLTCASSLSRARSRSPPRPTTPRRSRRRSTARPCSPRACARSASVGSAATTSRGCTASRSSARRAPSGCGTTSMSRCVAPAVALSPSRPTRSQGSRLIRRTACTAVSCRARPVQPVLENVVVVGPARALDGRLAARTGRHGGDVAPCACACAAVCDGDGDRAR